MSVIGAYKYIYGAGSTPNREIKFLRNGQDNRTIRAEVFAIVCNKPKKISDLRADQIVVEMMSIIEKINALQQERQGVFVERKPDRLISELSNKQLNAAMDFEPQGSWKIEPSAGFGSDPQFEKVTHLSIFKSS